MDPSDLATRRKARTREAVTIRMTEVLGMISELLAELRLVREQLRMLEKDEHAGTPVVRGKVEKRLLGATRPRWKARSETKGRS
jgi:hypothetical protein